MTPQPRIRDDRRRLLSVPDWLAALPSEQALIDATRVVIHTQEQAGIDLVCDGELSRFDVNHPETNGMIEYFVRPMARHPHRASRSTSWSPIARSAAWASARARRPWSKARSVAARSTCRRPARAPSGSPSRPFKFTLTGPHMLAKTLLRPALQGPARPRAWRSPTRSPRRWRTSTPTSSRSTKPTCRAARTNGNGPRRRSTACSTR